MVALAVFPATLLTRRKYCHFSIILHFNAKNAPNNTCYYQLTRQSIHLKVVVRVYFEWLNMRRKFRCSSCILGYVIYLEKVWKNASNNICDNQLTLQSIHLKVVVNVYFEWLNIHKKFHCSSCIFGYVINQEKVCHFSKTKLKIWLYCISMQKTHIKALVIAS